MDEAIHRTSNGRTDDDIAFEDKPGDSKNELKWKDIVCLSGQLSLKIPEELEKPSEKEAAEHFLHGQRPQEIWMDKYGSRILTFNLLELSLQEKQVSSAVREIQKMIGRLYPESIRESAQNLEAGGVTAGWFSFLTGGIREDQCHIMFVMPVNERMMFGSYHFPAGQKKEEQHVFWGMLKSVQMRKDTGEDGSGCKRQSIWTD